MKLPAEQEDWQKRPAYIKVNNAGVNICENRYLIDLPRASASLTEGKCALVFLCAVVSRSGYSTLLRRVQFSVKGE